MSNLRYWPAKKQLMYNFRRPHKFSTGFGALLPEAYQKFWWEWVRDPTPVHYEPEPGKWKRNPKTDEVTPVQNRPLKLTYPREFHEGIWGGETLVQGYKVPGRGIRRVPRFWFPTLLDGVIHSEVLNKHMNCVITYSTVMNVHKYYGFDHYLLNTSACDLKSWLALKLKRKILFALWDKTLYPDDEVKREEVYKKYEHYLKDWTREEIEWFGLTYKEAIFKIAKMREEKRVTLPLKIVYRQELLRQLVEESAKAT